MANQPINPAAMNYASSPSGKAAPNLDKADLDAKVKAQAAKTAEEPAKLAEATNTPPVAQEAVQVTLQGAVQKTSQTENKEDVSSQELKKMEERVVKRIQDNIAQVEGRSTSVGFQVSFENGNVIVRVVNRETGDVVREIPSEELRSMEEKLPGLKGLLVQDVS